MTTAISLVPAAELEKLRSIDTLAKTTRQQMIEFREDPFSAALTQARAIRMLNDMITPEMLTDVKALMNTPLGFKTDRLPPKQPYDDTTIKQTLIVATLRGFRHVNDEWNIIAGNFYATKNGLERQIAEFPGLTDLRISIGVPRTLTGGALVAAEASWKLNGQPDKLICGEQPHLDSRIPVKVNEYMGTDAIQGKAKRKLYAKILERLTGTEITTVDDAHDGEFTVEAVAAPASEPAAPTRTDDELLTELKTRLDAATTQLECQQITAIYDFASEDSDAAAAAMCVERRKQLKGRMA
jgi:hypothetical protein